MKKYGFTLVELMIVIAIIAILALVAVPSFKSFVGKAKRAEAYMNLHAIYAAQKAYWAEHGTYSTVLAGSGSVGWKPEGYKGGGVQEQFNYTYGFGNGSEGKNYFTGKLETPPSYLSKAYANNKGFLAIAAGYINGPGSQPDILSVDESNTITVVHDALGD